MIFSRAGSGARLLHRFQRVCAALEKENDLLAAGKLKDVAAMLPMKQKEMAALEDALSANEGAAEQKRALATPDLEEAARRFGILVRANRKLLKNAIDAQNAVIRLIVDAAQASSAGYVSSGHYGADTIASGALRLRSDV
ncbi:hypothetical protein [Gluconacetobacter diazotrophicus]|uniref:FlgN family protein n=1 Tax=Gluconacetobacter diazotrophicus (strain ATCC 49037 / DSM 5601 / CCUG 37298 / CIP 103539 / LMG 7603 / PAl5) TaxID=272568 RepID=A9HH52_GLUDA|nr:hypothetical protein [Gluconacetobacter diazotrophicus]CAP55594.1 hypothetical protein GDI1651 [Gluconacetobacter diazotrophicus PA1 5]